MLSATAVTFGAKSSGIGHHQRDLCHDRGVPCAVHDHGEPGRTGAIAPVAENQTDQKRLSPKTQLYCVQKRPCRRCRQNGARSGPKRFRPAPKQESAHRKIFANGSDQAIRDQEQPRLPRGSGAVEHGGQRRLPGKIHQRFPSQQKREREPESAKKIAPAWPVRRQITYEPPAIHSTASMAGQATTGRSSDDATLMQQYFQHRL
jgi:hypothetical protein